MRTVLDEGDLAWFHLGHDAVHQHVDDVVRLYTSPYLLHRQRHLYNHADERTSTSNVLIDRLQWTLDCDPASIEATLTHLQQVHSLKLFANIHVRRLEALVITMRTVLHRLDVLTGGGVVRCPTALACARTRLRLASGQMVGCRQARRDPDGLSMYDARAVAPVRACSRVSDDAVARRGNATHAFHVTLALGSAAACACEDRQMEHSVGSVDRTAAEQHGISATCRSAVVASCLSHPMRSLS